MAVTRRKANTVKKRVEESQSKLMMQDNFSLKSELILSTFERTIEMHSQLTEKMTHLCSCMDNNTKAMTELVQKLSPVAVHIAGVRRSINTIKYALIPIIMALATTTVALLLRILH